MNKKILITLGALLVSTTLIAGNCNSQKKGNANYCDTKSNCKTGMSGSKGGFIPMVMSLDLSDDQRTKIKTIVAKTMANTPNPHDAFSETNFDKKKFLKLAKEKRDAKLEKRAQMMHDVHAVLTKEQKVAFKKNLDAKPMMCDKKANNCDVAKQNKKRNCN